MYNFTLHTQCAYSVQRAIQTAMASKGHAVTAGVPPDPSAPQFHYIVIMETERTVVENELS